MNYSRLALAAVVTWIVDTIYGYGVFGILLANQFATEPAVFRPMEAVNANLPLLLAGTFVGMFVLAYIYAKGYEGGSGAQEGLRFGALIGLFGVAYMSVGQYATMNIGGRLAAIGGIAGFIEFVIDGIVLGVVYKPVPKISARSGAAM